MQHATRVFSAGRWSSALPRQLDSERTVVFAFGAPAYSADRTPFADLRSAFPRSHVVGCSTAGEIVARSILDGSVSVVVARFDRTDLRTAYEPVTRDDSFEAGVRLARAVEREDLRGCFVLSSGHDVNGSRLTEGLRSVLPRVPISGGLAGDGTRFGETWVLGREGVRAGLACIVGFYGTAIRLRHGTKGGWDKFGPERRITRSQANVLLELDGRPALDLYKSYLGELASGLPATALRFPLAIRPSHESSERLVRTVLAHSEAERSLTFAGDMPEGALAQLMRANFDRIIGAASEAATAALSVDAKLCLAVSCVGRRMVLRERAEEETDAVGDVLPGCDVAGFYSYGEISPTSAGASCLHNQTMTLTTFEEV
jgi:hypothetical protein